MIVVNDSPGQLCNRLWSYAPFIALALKERVRFVVPYFGEYAPLFEDLGKLPRVHFVNGTTHRYYRLWHHAFKRLRSMPTALTRAARIYIDRDNFGDERWDPTTLRRRFALVVLSAWNQPKPNLSLTSVRDELNALFRPAHQHTNKVDSLFAHAKESFDTIIGVHIRRGDYREFLGGRYYFEESVYYRIMKEIVDQLPGRRVGFILCSNEPVNIDSFPGLKCLKIRDGAGIEDLCALERCDYIVGPPSTFSMWASFCGRVPLWILEAAEQSVDLSAFKKIVAFHEFEDGTTFEYPPECKLYLEKLVSTR